MTPIRKELLAELERLADRAEKAGEEDLAWELSDLAGYQAARWRREAR